MIATTIWVCAAIATGISTTGELWEASVFTTHTVTDTECPETVSIEVSGHCSYYASDPSPEAICDCESVLEALVRQKRDEGCGETCASTEPITDTGPLLAARVCE